MRNRAVDQRHFDHLAGRLLLRLLDAGRHLIGLAVAPADLPRPSPTTTMAAKLKRRPPLTTAAQRLILTTRSMYSPRDDESVDTMWGAPELVLLHRRSGRGPRRRSQTVFKNSNLPLGRHPPGPRRDRGTCSSPRSNRTALMPAASAFSATVWPTILAASLLPPYLICSRRSLSRVLAETSVLPVMSSITWQADVRATAKHAQPRPLRRPRGVDFAR